MQVVRLLAMTVLLGAAMACGGSAQSAPATAAPPDEATPATSPAASAPSATSPAASAPAGGSTGRFPVPIVQGGEVVAEFPGEVTVAYPGALSEALVGFYRDYAVERGGVGGDTFDDGIEYQFDQDGETIVVTVTPDPPNTIVIIRVLP